MFVLVVSDVSIHAPTRGATRPSPLSYTGFPCFNPRTHTGCDFPHVHVFPYLVVSIHAPTRGATGITLWSKTIVSYCFNPRTHTGCDRAVGSPPVDEVLVSIHAPTRGATGKFKQTRQICPVSIHAPTRGATISPMSMYSLISWFQSTHPHGVRPILGTINYREYEFQSTHPHGVRRAVGSPPVDEVLVSIHAPTRGATRKE